MDDVLGHLGVLSNEDSAGLPLRTALFDELFVFELLEVGGIVLT